MTSSSGEVKIIQFDRTRRAYCFFTAEHTTPQDIISGLNLSPLPKGIIFISGGAAKFPPDTTEITNRLIEFAIAPFVYKHNLLIVDGGTQSGIMEITGEVLSRVTCPNSEVLPLMGFAPEPKVIYGNMKFSSQRQDRLDPNHSYFVLINETPDWCEAVETMFSFLGYLAEVKHLPIIQIVFNGGRITLKDAYYSVQRGFRIIVLDGSCRAPEVIVAAMNGASEADLIALLEKHEIAIQTHELKETLVWLQEIAEYNRITPFNFQTGHYDELKAAILSGLGSQQ